MKITSKTVNELNFLETGVEGIYILDRVAFKDKFDKYGSVVWKESTGKKKLQKWAERNLPDEILEQFEVDLPTIEEIFSQKALSRYTFGRELKSRQFPIFQNSDNRMMELDGQPMFWWTRSVYAGNADFVWSVDSGGGVNFGGTLCNMHGFVPVLRKKESKGNEAECWERLKEVAEEYAQKYMHPHKTIVITQRGIELSEGEKAFPFELLD